MIIINSLSKLHFLYSSLIKTIMLNWIPTLVEQEKQSLRFQNKNISIKIWVVCILILQLILAYYILQPIDRNTLSFTLILFWPALASILLLWSNIPKEKTSFSHAWYYCYSITSIASLFYLIAYALQVAWIGKSWEEAWIIVLFPLYWALFFFWGWALWILMVTFYRLSRKKKSD